MPQLSETLAAEPAVVDMVHKANTTCTHQSSTQPPGGAGLAAGLLTVCLFPPLGQLLLGGEGWVLKGTTTLKGLLDVGLCGIIVNVAVFILVSFFSPRPEKNHREAFARDLKEDLLHARLAQRPVDDPCALLARCVVAWVCVLACVPLPPVS